MATIGELLIKLGLDPRGVAIGAAIAKGDLVAMSKSMTGTMTKAAHDAEKSAGGVGGAFAKVPKVVGVAGAAVVTGVVGIGIAAVHSADQFQAAMELIHTQAGASQGEVDSMSKSVLAMGGTVPQGPDQLAAALYHIESAGKRGATALDILHAAAKGAAVGGADLESVTNALIAADQSGVKGVQDMTGAMGTLNAIVGSGNMRMQDLTDAMGTGVLSTAKNYGVSLQSVGAALADMTDQGIPAIDAATRLNSAMRLMAAPVPKAITELKTIGISQFQLANDMRGPGGITAAIEDLKSHLSANIGPAVSAMVRSIEAGHKSAKAGIAAVQKTFSGLGFSASQVADIIAGHFTKLGLTASQQAALLANAFGGKQSGAILTLVGNVDLLRQKTASVGQGAGKFGEDWRAAQQTTAVQMAELKASFGSLMVAIGTGLLPAVEAILKAVTPIIMAIAHWAAQNPGLTATILAIVGVLGALGVAIAVIGPIVGAVVGAFALLNPVTLLIGAIIVIVVLLATHWQQLGQVVGAVVRAITGFVEGLVSTIAGAVGNIVAFFLSIPTRVAAFETQLGQQVAGLAGRIVSTIAGAVGTVVSAILSIPARTIGWIVNVVQGAVTAGQRFLAAVVGMAGDVVATILGIPGKLLAGLVAGFANLAGSVVKAFVNGLASIPSAVGKLLGHIPGVGLVGNVLGAIPHLQTGAENVPTDMIALIHQGEMVLPPDQAAVIRTAKATRAPAGASALRAGSAGISVQQAQFGVSNATAGVGVAQARLAEDLRRRHESHATIMAAELALTKARQRLTLAHERLALAEERAQGVTSGRSVTVAASPVAMAAPTAVNEGSIAALTQAILAALRQQPLVGTLNINNPQPEPAGQSIANEMRAIGQLGLGSFSMPVPAAAGTSAS